MPSRRFPALAERFRLVAFVGIAALLPPTHCGHDGPEPPSQQAVEQCWHRADQAVQQAADAEQQTRHERRLQDIDRAGAADMR